MIPNEPAAQAAVQSQGAVFHRCALQVNLHQYAGKFRGQKASGDPQSHANAIVKKAEELGISMLAITDHNSVSGVALFQDAVSGRKIAIFPGFELCSSDGVHVLCIYPPETQEDQLRLFLGAFGIQTPTASSELSSKSFMDVLAQVREQGGVAIAAHATSATGGLFEVLSGQSRIKAWQSEFLTAIQIPGSADDLPQDVRKIVRNKNPEYRRLPAGDNLGIALVNAKDIVRAEDLAGRSATCWIKMSEISIEGLRQAFLDPESRIRLASDKPLEDHAELLSLSWEGGFLGGSAIRFNQNLNVLVGGRGAGKSTVLESLRYTLGLTPIGDAACAAHSGIVSKVLRGGTKITLEVRSQQAYRIERTVPNPPVVRSADGTVSNLLPKDILPGIEVYGQHEISELTGSREKLTLILNRFIDPSISFDQRKNDLRRSLEKSRRSIVEVQAELQEVEESLAALPGLEETLERFKAAGLENRLREQSLLVREERLLNSIPERLEAFNESLRLLRQELPIDRAFLSEKGLEGLPGKEILAGADAILERLNTGLEQAARQLEAALRQADQGISEVRTLWNLRKNEVQAGYQKILRELKKSAVDGEEFIRLRREIEALRPLQQRQSLLHRTEQELLSQRGELLAEWEEVKAQEFRALDKAAKNVSKRLRQQVEAKVTAAGDREPLFKLLRSEIGGRLRNAIEKLRACAELSLADFADACRQGAEGLQVKYDLTPGEARNIAEAKPEVFMQIEELCLPPTTAIQLNTAPAGEPPQWQFLEDLSTGQKATAVLLLLLLESDAPLIIDQPEDDLDNRFITESIVPKMREEKCQRQFIFSTHNANIPVLGDAEMIIGLAASGEAEGGSVRIAPEHVGAIDALPVRELIEEVLEGGKDAFERRRRKYGF